MARIFDDGSSQYLEYVGTPPVSDVPLTLYCWIYPITDGSEDCILAIADASETSGYIGMSLRGDAAGNPIRAFQYGFTGGSYQSATSTAGVTFNAWNQACAVFVSDAERHAYCNGGNKGSDTSNAVNVATWDVVSVARVGDSSPGYNFGGHIAEAAIWNVALTDDEVALLYKGYSPLFVRPESLVLYLPLIRDNDTDLINGITFTAYNTPTIGAHCPVLYPAPRLFSSFSVSAEATYTVTAAAAAILKEVYTKSAAGAATLKEMVTASAAGQALLKMVVPVSAATNAILKEAYSKTSAAQSHLQDRIINSTAGQTWLQMRSSTSAAANAVLKEAYTKTVAAQATLKEAYTKSAAAQAILKELYTKAAAGQAWVQDRISTASAFQAALQDHISNSAAAQAILKEVYTTASALQAYLRDIGAVTAAVAMAARLKETVTKSAAGQAILKTTASALAAGQAWLHDRISATASAWATLKETASVTAAINAYLLDIGGAVTPDLYAPARGFTLIADKREFTLQAPPRAFTLTTEKKRND